MFAGTKRFLAPSLLGLALCLTPAPTRAEDGWTVSKSSGEVWVDSAGAQPVSLTASEILKPGETIRTGQNGRVLLARGEETILIAPNSVVGISAEKKDGMSTTILQRAGSILLEVEKRKENHFEVETPYLAAVVKGTQFRVTVGKSDTRVNVTRGRVEVTDFKTGQHVAVLPGQTAKVLPQGRAGLFLSGSGTLAPVEPGKPRAPSLEPSTPKSGITTAHNMPNGLIRISAPLGEVNFDVKKATKGFAHAAGGPQPGRGEKREADTVWNSRELAPGNAAAQGNGGGNSGNGGNGNGGNGNGGNGNDNGNAYGHLSCNPKSKGKSGC
jgi:FecR protein